jgi:hypothetical protein
MRTMTVGAVLIDLEARTMHVVNGYVLPVRGASG